jgi:serine/threonine protein kinase/tetratricopeptide (TPR) repeat protein
MQPANEPNSAVGGQTNRLVGQTIGDFEILEEIGRGGMGVVFKARQISLDRMVAFKILSQSLGLTEHTVARFRREAQATAKLHHPNIVPIYAQGQQDDTYYYAMELVSGASLHDIIRDLRTGSEGDEAADVRVGGSSVSPELALAETELLPSGSRMGRAPGGSGGSGSSPRATHDGSAAGSSAAGASSSGSREDPRFAVFDEAYFDTIARQLHDVADALDYAHRHGVIHRDIKPHNLLVGHGGRLCLTDFGLARVLAQPGMTQTGEFIGSPLYMSPEQITGRGSVGVASDIYSLGATLYEWLTLSPPYPAETREQVISQVITSEVVMPRVRNRRVPLDLETICAKAMAKDPQRRYPSAADLRDDLKSFLNRSRIKARRDGFFATASKFLSRRRVAVIATVSLLAVATLFGLLVRQGRDMRRQEAQVEAKLDRVDTVTEENERLARENERMSDLIESKMKMGAQMADMLGAESVISGIFSTGDGEAYEPTTVEQRIGAMFIVGERERLADRISALALGAVAPESAEAAYLQALIAESADDALAALEQCLLRQGAVRDALWLRAWVYCQLNRVPAMRADADAILEHDPDDAGGRIARGVARMLSGEKGLAEEDLAVAAKHMRGDYRLEVINGLLLAADQRMDAAVAALGRALVLNPDCVLARMRRADVNLTLGHAEVALMDVQRVIELEPGNAEAYERRAACNDRLERYGEAFDDYMAAHGISNRHGLLLRAYSAALNRDEQQRLAQGDAADTDPGDESLGGADAQAGESNPPPATEQIPAVPPSGRPGVFQSWLRHLLNGVLLPGTSHRTGAIRAALGKP